jgi:hypothetical protein
MMATHGGARQGAGRPKKDRSGQDFFEDAQSYLLAVVRGLTLPDAVRVQAARTLIQYEKAKKRAPVPSPSAAQLQKKAEIDLEKSTATDFEEKAARIRAKYQR